VSIPSLRLTIATVPFLALLGCNDPVGFRIPDPDTRIIAFGDSATAGADAQGYPEMLPGLLAISADSVANEGVGGEETAAGLPRLRSLIDREIFPNAENIILWEGGVDLIHFVAGSDPNLQWNPADEGYPLRDQLADVLDKVESNLSAMAGLAQAAGWNVYLVTYFPISTANACPLFSFELNPQQAQAVDAYFHSLNERIRSAASNNDCVLIDVAAIGSQLQSDPANYLDCNHLSDQGNALVADQIAKAFPG
jgi:lysophospholipase L1-like esterase